MVQEIDGVGFAIEAFSNGAARLSVTSISTDSRAVEFIIDAVDGSWSSDVIAARVENGVTIPQVNSRRLLRVRLFDTLGQELDRESNACLEVVGNRLQPKSSKTTGGFRNQIVVSVLVIVGCFSLWSVLGSGIFSKTEPAGQGLGLASPDLAVLARSANLRSAPVVLKENVLSTLPFGTRLLRENQTGEFLEVQVFGGQKGYIHRDVVGGAVRVHELGLNDSLEQARTVVDDRRELILGAAREVRPLLLTSTLFSSTESNNAEASFQTAVARTAGDDVSARFFHYLAEEAAARRDFKKAVVYFRAAAISNPLSVTDVHGWGVTQLRDLGTVDETSFLHAAVVAPQSTNTWLMVAGYLAGRGSGATHANIVSALRLAVSFSSNRIVTKRFFSDLGRSTSNENLKSALNEVKDTI